MTDNGSNLTPDFIRRTGASAAAAGYTRIITWGVSLIGAPLFGFFLSAVWSSVKEQTQALDKVLINIAVYEERFSAINRTADDHERRLRHIEAHGNNGPAWPTP